MPIILQVWSTLDCLGIILLRELFDFELAVFLDSAVLNLNDELVLIVTTAIPVLEVVKEHVDHSDIE